MCRQISYYDTQCKSKRRISCCLPHYFVLYSDLQISYCVPRVLFFFCKFYFSMLPCVVVASWNILWLPLMMFYTGLMLYFLNIYDEFKISYKIVAFYEQTPIMMGTMSYKMLIKTLFNVTRSFVNIIYLNFNNVYMCKYYLTY